MRASTLLLLCVILFVHVPSIDAQTGDIARPVRAGATTISGFISPAPMMATSVTIEVTAPNDGGTPRIVARQQAMAAAGTGAFSFTLPAGVGVGYTVILRDTATLAMRDQVEVGPLTAPVLRGPIPAGTRAIEGTADPDTRVRVTVHPPFRPKREDVNVYIQQADSRSDADGRFQIVLPSSVLGGQHVEAVALAGPDRSRAADLSVTDPGDWGRTRSYFAGGVVLSKKRNNFSEQDLTMAFTLDKSWFQTQAMTLPPDQDSIQVAERAAETLLAGDTKPDATLKSRRWFAPRQFNTFFDARMTALPVKQGTSTQTTTTTSAGAQTTAPATTPVNEFIASQKGATVQIGMYAPLYGPKTSWIHQAQVNTLFAAPVFRFGIQTITEDPAPAQSSTIPGTSGGTQTIATRTVATAPDEDDVFHFWSVGFGVGHYRLTGTRNEAPELISYLHITWGKAEAFESKGADGVIVKPSRWFVEGRLKIPDTALQVGFDANLGAGPDDVRFVFGTRFDLGAVIGRMKQLN